MEMKHLLETISKLSEDNTKKSLTESKDATHKGGSKSVDTEKGVTKIKHQGKYGSEYQGDEDDESEEGKKAKKAKAADAPKRGRGRPKKGADSSTGQVASYDNAKSLQSFMVGNIPKKGLPGKASKKHTLKDWIDSVDREMNSMITEFANTMPTTTSTSTGTPQFKVTNNPDGSKEVIDTNTGLSREYPQAASSMASTDATRMNAAAQKKAQDAAAAAATAATTAVTEDDLDEKWDAKMHTAKKDVGMFDGWSLEKLKAAKKKLMSKEERTASEQKRVKQLTFAIRAKQEGEGKWGKVKADEAEMPGPSFSPLSMTKRGMEESKKAKPDFLDLDKDGNKKEPMKSASKTSSMKKVKEGRDHGQAAYLEGKSHAIGGHSFSCRHNEGSAEHQHYLEGYKHGLDECYGGGMMEEGMGDMFRGKSDADLVPVEPFKRPADGTSKAALKQTPGSGLPMHGSQYDSPLRRGMERVGKMFKEEGLDEEFEDDMEEGNAFTGALAKTPKGGKFSIGGKTFKDTSSIEEDDDPFSWAQPVDETVDELSAIDEITDEASSDVFAMSEDATVRAWDSELNKLLNEGVTISTSTGQQGMPDSVSVNATDTDARQLMKILQLSGLSAGGNMPNTSSDTASSDDYSDDYSDEGSYKVYTNDETCSDCGCEDCECTSDEYSHDDSNGDDGEHEDTPLTPSPRGFGVSVNVDDDNEEYDANDVVDNVRDHDEVIDAFSGNANNIRSVMNKLIAMEALDSPKKPKSRASEKTEDKPKSAKVENQIAVLKKLSGQSGKDKKDIHEDAMPMPDGMMFSEEPTEDQVEFGDTKNIKEPVDPDEVLNALSKGSKKELSKNGDSEFSDLKRLIGDYSDGSKATKSSESNDDSEDKSDDDSEDEKKVDESQETCNECGNMLEEGHECESEDYPGKKEDDRVLDEWKNSLRETERKSKTSKSEKPSKSEDSLKEWANSAGSDNKDEQFTTDSEFMVNSISGGLNRKKVDQTVNPHTKVKVSEHDERTEAINDWLRLAGIKK